ncbi:MAG: amino acid permease [Ignavibacteria bacterium]|jgi:amino acid transporter|nr:amino acid permease [Ignavibacteria bacterium]MCU7502834.1 amino acid permease [Ignavibacteria bacterium]MCU7515672.1 amino acid permease [Ignavibacteria bacterium]
MHESGKNNSAGEFLVTSKQISVAGGVAIVSGMVIGPGIFKTPSIVAANSGSEIFTLGLWLLGGVISLLGALCYAELTSTYPHAGGEYHFLSKSFGKRLAFLFAWARMTVIQTGSIVMLSFIIGDYASEALRLGTYSSSIYAALTVLVLTGINLSGLRSSSRLQMLLLSGMLFGIMTIVLTGLYSSYLPSAGVRAAAALPAQTSLAPGRAMIFVLLTYGGWNEAAYISADVKRNKNGIVRVLLYSTGIITFTYLIINFSLLKGFGFSNVAASEAVAADFVMTRLGRNWVKMISLLISASALSTVNAVMITGARTNYALGQDFRFFRFLARWSPDEKSPKNAFLFQSAIALLLIVLGSLTRSGFVTMVEYTAPVFWFFFLLAGITLFILRYKEPHKFRPFTVPLYPLVPILFCLSAAYMLHSSLSYTGIGALIGVCVLLAGIPFLFIKNDTTEKKEEQK